VYHGTFNVVEVGVDPVGQVEPTVKPAIVDCYGYLIARSHRSWPNPSSGSKIILH
jgi:hypothetical protein